LRLFIFCAIQHEEKPHVLFAPSFRADAYRLAPTRTDERQAMGENEHEAARPHPAEPRHSKLSIVPLWGLILCIWTGAFMASLWHNLDAIERYAVDSARIQARTAFEKDVMYRRWNAQLGGIMAPAVPGRLEPNPYLALAGRDMTGVDGTLYTKVNPAFMTRLVHELGASESGVLGHITSNRPIRKGNEPDAWEGAALTLLETGTTHEVSGLETMRGVPYLRFIRPLMVEESCLSCHAYQGYEMGQIRGGISVSVPMEPITRSLMEPRRDLALVHVGLWALGVCGVSLYARQLSRSIKARERVDALLRQQITRRIALEKILREVAETDMLTRLPNRRTALKRLHVESKRHIRDKAAFSLLMVDIDHFKSINDTWGHAAGDKALVAVAARLRSVMREEDAVSRWGGEEFLLLLVETPLNAALLAAERIRADVAAARVDIGEASVALTVSIGVAEFQPGLDIARNINNADDALYAAKRLGRNRVEAHTANPPEQPPSLPEEEDEGSSPAQLS
jgi:diguanylate cyclase (GGDEF)-like protein